MEETIFNTTELETERDKAIQDTTEVTVLIDQLLASATSTTLDPDEFDTRYADLTARYETALATRDKLEAEIADRKARHGQGKAALDYLGLQRPLEYSDEAWALPVDHVNVRVDGELTVIFKDAAQPSS